jgi:hypothetical protein
VLEEKEKKGNGKDRAKSIPKLIRELLMDPVDGKIRQRK